MGGDGLVIEQVPLASLRPDERNPRRMGDHEVAALKRSLEEYGAVEPAVVNADGTIIGGHMRVEAARLLGWQSFPIVRVELSDEKARLLNLALNRIHGEWDEDKLTELLWQLREEDADLVLSGFDSREIDRLLASVGPSPGDDTEPIEPPAEPRTKPGDLWLLGEHRLLCGDATVMPDIDRVVKGAIIGTIVTDPPYGIDANKMTLGNGKKNFQRGEDWDRHRPSILHLVALAPQLVIWGGNYFADVLPVTNDWLCWHKKISNVSFSEFELAWTNLGRNARIFDHHWSGEEKNHPTQKPLPVIEWCLGLTAGDVLDPFAGSGTTLIAAENLRRRCFAMEIDPGYCDVIVDRWERHTGKEAVLGTAYEVHA